MRMRMPMPMRIRMRMFTYWLLVCVCMWLRVHVLVSVSVWLNVKVRLDINSQERSNAYSRSLLHSRCSSPPSLSLSWVSLTWQACSNRLVCQPSCLGLSVLLFSPRCLECGNLSIWVTSGGGGGGGGKEQTMEHFGIVYFPVQHGLALAGQIFSGRLSVNSTVRSWTAFVYFFYSSSSRGVCMFPYIATLQERTVGKWAENERKIGEIPPKIGVPEFIARMGYHFRRKIGRRSAEIGRIRKHVGGKMRMGYHRRKISGI